jgi:antitoxin CptB
MTDDIDIRRKRLRFRSWHRGTKEIDLVLGNFADRYLDGFSADQLDRYERLLECEDVDLWSWIVGRAAVPPEQDCDVTRLLTQFRLGTARAS